MGWTHLATFASFKNPLKRCYIESYMVVQCNTNYAYIENHQFSWNEGILIKVAWVEMMHKCAFHYTQNQ